MNRNAIKKKFATIHRFYAKQKPPITVLVNASGVDKEATMELWREYLQETGEPIVKKTRKPRAKKEPTPQIIEIPEKPIPIVEVKQEQPTLLGNILKYVTTVGYVFLIILEMIVSAVSSGSTAHNFALSIVMIIAGVIIVFMGTALFLKGVNSTNTFEKIISILAWILYVLLFTWLNWSWTVGQLEAEWASASEYATLQAQDKTEYDGNIAKMNEVSAKLSKASVWTPPAVIASYTEILNGYKASNVEIRKRLDSPRTENSATTFITMGGLFNKSAETAARIFYLGLFLLIQFLIVLVVPKIKKGA